MICSQKLAKIQGITACTSGTFPFQVLEPRPEIFHLLWILYFLLTGVVLLMEDQTGVASTLGQYRPHSFFYHEDVTKFNADVVKPCD